METENKNGSFIDMMKRMKEAREKFIKEGRARRNRRFGKKEEEPAAE